MSVEDCYQYIYLIKPREYKDLGLPIVKAGKTKRPLYQRVNNYPTDSYLIYSVRVNNCDTAEKFILNLLRRNFRSFTIGDEFFVAEEQEARDLMELGLKEAGYLAFSPVVDRTKLVFIVDAANSGNVNEIVKVGSEKYNKYVNAGLIGKDDIGKDIRMSLRYYAKKKYAGNKKMLKELWDKSIVKFDSNGLEITLSEEEIRLYDMTEEEYSLSAKELENISRQVNEVNEKIAKGELVNAKSKRKSPSTKLSNSAEQALILELTSSKIPTEVSFNQTVVESAGEGNDESADEDVSEVEIEADDSDTLGEIINEVAKENKKKTKKDPSAGAYKRTHPDKQQKYNDISSAQRGDGYLIHFLSQEARTTGITKFLSSINADNKTTFVYEPILQCQFEYRADENALVDVMKGKIIYAYFVRINKQKQYNAVVKLDVPQFDVYTSNATPECVIEAHEGGYLHDVINGDVLNNKCKRSRPAGRTYRDLNVKGGYSFVSRANCAPDEFTFVNEADVKRELSRSKSSNKVSTKGGCTGGLCKNIDLEPSEDRTKEVKTKVIKVSDLETKDVKKKHCEIV